ncbi:alpha/beta fold hydrolase [Streptomyces sp. NPDC047042]|uniref:alpha/beta fold hydrolase n=1 Tax=Streptomyces sp. NPDC047042 TaxID=3154807 RepID=UPI0033E7D80F
MSAPVLSPDGTSVAYADADGLVTVTHTATRTVRPVLGVPPGAVHSLAWSPNGTHLLLITETSGREHFTLHGLRLSGTPLPPRPLSPDGTVQVRGLWTAPARPHGVVTAVRRRGERGLHPWYVPLGGPDEAEDPHGAGRRVAVCPDGTRDWAFDSELACRACLVGHPDGTLSLLATDDGHDWRPLTTFPLEDAPDTRLLGVHPSSGEVLLLTAYRADAVRVAAVHPGDGRLRTLLAAPPYDVATAWLAPDGTAQATLHHAARRHYTCADPAYRRDLDTAAALDTGDLELLGRDLADRHWLLAFHHPDRPPRHHVYDRRRATATPLTRHTPLDPTSARTTSARTGGIRSEHLPLTASDGLPLTAYLTFPVQPPDALTPPPLLLRIHGGPWSHDVWRHDPEARRFAAEGIAVLRLNYRGSSGYGRHFRDLGDAEWGGRMQQDLYDAVDDMVARGLGDPDRIAAYGGSYGGYAALLALTDPRFRCAVAVNPLVDLASDTWADSPYWRRMRPLWDKQIGWSRLSRDELRRRSPLHRVDTMTGPALVVRGANDPRIDAAGIEDFVRLRRAVGGEVDELVLPNDGHAVRSGPGKRAFQQALSSFLTQHLGIVPAGP